jgi:hypothetical protein
LIRGLLFPASDPLAVVALPWMRLFPLRDRARLVVAHLVIHAGTIFLDDSSRSTLVRIVCHALPDPLDVIRIRKSGSARQSNSEKDERGKNKLHENPRYAASRKVGGRELNSTFIFGICKPLVYQRGFISRP